METIYPTCVSYLEKWRNEYEMSSPSAKIIDVYLVLTDFLLNRIKLVLSVLGDEELRGRFEVVLIEMRNIFWSLYNESIDGAVNYDLAAGGTKQTTQSHDLNLSDLKLGNSPADSDNINISIVHVYVRRRQ